jgi:hypothetical protein
VWEVFSELHNEVEEIIEVRRRRHAREQKTHGRMRHTELKTHFRWAVVGRRANTALDLPELALADPDRSHRR